MKQKSLRLNVAFIPPKKVAHNAIQLSKKLGSKNTFFSLDAKHHPHLTLYMSDFPPQVLPRMRKVLEFHLSLIPPVRFVTPEFIKKPSGFVEIRFKNNLQLKKLQKEIISFLNPLRKGVPAHQEVFTKFSPLEQKNTKKYGYPAIGSLYQPHITLTRLKNPLLRMFSPRSVKKFSFVPREMGIFAVGEYGTGKRLLARIPIR